MKVLLVPVADRPESVAAVNIAFDLAERLQASVVGAHLRPHRDPAESYKSKGLPLFGSADEAALSELSRKHSPASLRAAHKLFAATAEQNDFTLAKGPRIGSHKQAIWQELVGSPDKLMAIAGPLADLTVVSRPARSGRLGRMFVLAALLQSGRPVLVLPQRQKQAPGKRIAIAWNQSAEASRTLHACMPLLRNAAQVTILSCGSEDRRGPKSAQLVAYLKHWDIKAAAVRTPGRDEHKELLQAYKDTDSDLLVMGAYSRSRLREVVLGGMTEKMLWDAQVPVIMQHT